jgi:hypothetical protein
VTAVWCPRSLTFVNWNLIGEFLRRLEGLKLNGLTVHVGRRQIRQKNGALNSIEDLRQLGAFMFPVASLRPSTARERSVARSNCGASG